MTSLLTMADLERMSDGNLAQLQAYFGGVLASYVAHSLPERKEDALGWLREKGYEPVGVSKDGVALLAPPGRGAETMMKETLRDFVQALDLRVDWSSWQATLLGKPKVETWNIERFGRDGAQGVEILLLNELDPDQAQFARDKHPQALAINRYYHFNAQLARTMERMEHVEAKFFRLGDMPEKLRLQMQLGGWDLSQGKPQHSTVYLLNQKDPALAAAYLVARAEVAPPTVADLDGKSAFDPGAMRQMMESKEQPAGSMMVQKLVRQCPGLGGVLATYAKSDLGDMRTTLVAAFNRRGGQLDANLSPQSTLEAMEAIAQDCRKQAYRNQP